MLALLPVSLPLLAADLERDPLRFLLPFLRTLVRDLRLGVRGLDLTGSGSGGKARTRLDMEEDRDGGRCNYITYTLKIQEGNSLVFDTCTSNET